MAVATDPGRYDKRMILWREALGDPSPSGDQTSTARELARVWCSLSPVQGREYLVAAQTRSESSHVIRTWYRADVAIDAACWFTLGSRRFDIESVIDVDEAHREWEIRVREH